VTRWGSVSQLCHQHVFRVRCGGGFLSVRRPISLCIWIIILSACGGCAELHRPENRAPQLYDKERSQPGRRDPDRPSQQTALGPFGHSLKDNPSFVNTICPPAGTPEYIQPGPRGPTNSVSHRELTMRYSTGDRFNVQVPGAAEFSGDYVVNADGRVILPFAGELPVRGQTNAELTRAIEQSLIKAKLFEAQGFKIAVRPVKYAPINVTVSGAVFLRGRVTIGGGSDEKSDRALTKTGDSAADRFVGAALRAASGVRPDADLANVRLTRNGKTFVLNWRGALTGEPVDDIPLLDGDHIHVGEAACFQSALVRPSQITLTGIRLLVSNLTVPANNNANSMITKDGTSLPYGTRLLSGVVVANCAGGTLASNAGRYAVLITRNPKTMETEVIQRSIEELILSPDRDTINPYLMPDDAIVCYDSAITDVRETANTLSTLLAPFSTWQNAVNAGVKK
jgi:polysaccharide biosynthesis/export protein